MFGSGVDETDVDLSVCPPPYHAALFDLPPDWADGANARAIRLVSLRGTVVDERAPILGSPSTF